MQLELAKESGQRFFELIDNLPIIVVATSRERIYTFASQRFIDFIGYSREELYQLTIMELIAEESHRALEENITRLISQDIFAHEYELTVINKSGVFLQLEVIIIPLPIQTFPTTR